MKFIAFVLVAAAVGLHAEDFDGPQSVSIQLNKPYIRALEVELKVIAGCYTGCAAAYTAHRSGGYELSAYVRVRVQADAGGLCEEQPRQWTAQTELTITGSSTRNGLIPIGGDGDLSCTLHLVRLTVLSLTGYSAKGEEILIQGDPPSAIDFTEQLKSIQSRLEAEKRRKEAEDRRKEAEDRRMKAAAAAAKQRAAQEAKELKAWEIRQKAEEQAKQERILANCQRAYNETVNVKVKDLTVGQEQLVHACQILGLYPPRQ